MLAGHCSLRIDALVFEHEAAFAGCSLMDSYLAIARAVLKNARQPLSARQILKAAHQLQMIPRDLYGRTQHKTLQARLASDILKHRSKSEFYRTGPGRFFLRTFQRDGSIPQRYRQEYQAPLRAAQLGRFDVVAFPRAALAEFISAAPSKPSVANLMSLPWSFVRLYSLRRHADLVPFRFLLLLTSNGRLFLDNRKPVALHGDLHRHSMVGLEGVVKREDLSLFSADKIGLLEAATRTLLEQFDLPRDILPAIEDKSRWSKAHVIVDAKDDRKADLIVYLRFQCAGIREVFDAVNARPTAEWVPIPLRPNDVERFDKWSSHFIANASLQTELCD